LPTVRPTYWTLLVAFASNVGLAVLAGTLIAPRLSANDKAHVDVVQLALAGLRVSQIAFGVLGVLVIAGEYGSGMIRTTFAAAPRRQAVLAAKALVFTVTALIAGAASTFAAYFAFRAVLPANTLTSTGLGDRGVARAVLGGGLYMTAIGLLGFGLAVVLRSVAGGIATLFGLIFVPPLLLDLLPGTLRGTVGPYLPMVSGEQVYIAARHETGQLGVWTGFGVFCLYAAAALIAGFALVNHRDA
jgi:ABC-2 type transport system permease protein